MVLMGGPSSEHEVSLASGKNVIAALDPKKYLARPVIISKNGKLPALPRADVAFIAMHGKYGEDGTIQAILEALKIPYTGSGVLASALGMDKPRASAVFKAAGLNVPDFLIISKKGTTKHSLVSGYEAKLRSWKMAVVKPANHGSSVGISIVKNTREFKQGIREAFRHSDRVMVQKFIKGRELTCGVLEIPPHSSFRKGGIKSLSLPLYPSEIKGDLAALPPTEIRPQKGPFYDYRSKYEEGGSEHITPPPGLSKKMIKTVQETACRAHQVIGCSGMSRSDFILGEDGKLYILEINTIPGMTATSLLPEAAKTAGISFSKFLDMLIENALRRPR